MTFTKEQLIEDLKASSQNATGMFEISEGTTCSLMSLLTAPQPLTTSERAELENYRNAQQVVHVDADDNFYSWFGRFWSENYQQNNYTTSAKQMLGTMAEFGFRAGRESAIHAGNSPVIPDGWVMVPVDPTEDMIIQGFESEPDESFSEEKDWLTYEAMSGCQQAAHRAKLCWAAMIAAAPQQEAK
ncbi:hypothetical protein [Lelliottia amnigena]